MTRQVITMRYYSENRMKETRSAFEEKVLRWPRVRSKNMFGCPSYQANGNLFAFLVTNGIVITELSQANREKLSSKHQTNSFQAGKRIVKGWIEVTVTKKTDLREIVSFVRESYRSALEKSTRRS